MWDRAEHPWVWMQSAQARAGTQEVTEGDMGCEVVPVPQSWGAPAVLPPPAAGSEGLRPLEEDLGHQLKLPTVTNDSLRSVTESEGYLHI